MDLPTNQIWHEEVDGEGRVFDELDRASVLRELDAILNSPIFQPSKRCQQFLSYVVHHRLEGSRERLKERTIGVDLFQRPAGYATGDDPVVRVQAGEVRRRLDQYYQANPNASAVRIELHVGSYTPEFKWANPALDLEHPLPLQPYRHFKRHPANGARPGISPGCIAPVGRNKACFREAQATSVDSAGSRPRHVGRFRTSRVTIYRARAHQSVLQEFWSPRYPRQSRF